MLLVTSATVNADNVINYGGDVSVEYTVTSDTPLEVINKKIPQTGLYEESVNPEWMFLASLVILLILLMLYRQKIKEEYNDTKMV